MSLKQSLFKFPEQHQYVPENFIISDSNHHAYNLVMKWPNWGNGPYANILLLYGKPTCGKTHLTHLWQRQANATFLNSKAIESQLLNTTNSCYIIDGIEAYLPLAENLFHLFNSVVEHQQYLLITASQPPSRLDISLPDLKSRLQAINWVEIQEPDDQLLRQLMLKLFSDRQIKVKMKVIDYILSRIGRSCSDINQIVRLLDHKSLSEHKEINIKLVHDFLKQY